MSNYIHLEGEILQIKGATKVASSTPTQAVVEMSGSAVVLSGNGIEVKKLNLEENEVHLQGKFQNIKFSESVASKGSFLKRIFK